jgi:hypothetical protein
MRSFDLAMQRGEQPSLNSMLTLAGAYTDAVTWMQNLAEDQEIVDHTDSFFVNEIVLRLAESFREVKGALLESAAEGVVPRLAAVQLPGATQLQRHPARLRVAVHPAATLG